MTTDARAKVALVQQKTGEGVKTMEALWYGRDRDNAYLIVMLSPESDKGVGYLRVSDNFWMYRPNTRTFQHINRDESIGGSNAHGENFENRKLTELYEGLKTAAGKDSISEECWARCRYINFPLKQRSTTLTIREKCITRAATTIFFLRRNASRHRERSCKPFTT